MQKFPFCIFLAEKCAAATSIIVFTGIWRNAKLLEKQEAPGKKVNIRQNVTADRVILWWFYAIGVHEYSKKR